MFRKLAHVCLITNDLDRLIGFYCDKLGFTLQFYFRNDADEKFGAYIACGDTTFIEIFDQHKAAAVWGGDASELHHGNQYSHFCLEVTAINDVRDTLIGRGVEVGAVKRGIDNSDQCWITDPDGNRIELMEYTHRSGQINPPEPRS
jgi:catechol 2,3-dioxygenase-like lactoylglutathione lyase family enzyme